MGMATCVILRVVAESTPHGAGFDTGMATCVILRVVAESTPHGAGFDMGMATCVILRVVAESTPHGAGFDTGMAFGLCYLYLRNLKGFIWNRKRVYHRLNRHKV